MDTALASYLQRMEQRFMTAIRDSSLEMLAEMDDRRRRESNVIVSGLLNSDKSLGDAILFQQLCSTAFGFTPEVLSTQRFEGKNGSILKVQLISVFVRNKVLALAPRLKTYKTGQTFIRQDRTKQQAEQFRSSRTSRPPPASSPSRISVDSPRLVISDDSPIEKKRSAPPSPILMATPERVDPITVSATAAPESPAMEHLDTSAAESSTELQLSHAKENNTHGAMESTPTFVPRDDWNAPLISKEEFREAIQEALRKEYTSQLAAISTAR
jgi:hypothetical protein